MVYEDTYVFHLKLEDLFDILTRSSKKCSSFVWDQDGFKIRISMDSVIRYIAEKLFFGDYKDLARDIGLEINIKDLTPIQRKELISSHGYWRIVETGYEGIVEIVKKVRETKI